MLKIAHAGSTARTTVNISMEAAKSLPEQIYDELAALQSVFPSLKLEGHKEKLRIEEQTEKLRIEEREEKLRIEQLRLDEQKRKDEFELEKLKIETQSNLGADTSKETKKLEESENFKRTLKQKSSSPFVKKQEFKSTEKNRRRTRPALYVENRQIKKELEKFIQNDKPEKTASTDVTIRIILKDEEPVCQPPRQLAFTERQEVNKQIEEWLNEGNIRPSSSE
ncbi:retrovirus-related Pol polyprotein from transposon 412 [Trichonephila clavipes]|nr:retrovirus-related Pol polyprotein from transposon 412 [Trichonephila clavipes]